jgi:signal transduction histidine kinase
VSAEPGAGPPQAGRDPLGGSGAVPGNRGGSFSAVPLRRAADLPPSHEELQADQVRTLLHQTIVALAANLVGTTLVAGMFWPIAPAAPMLLWLGAGVLLWTVRLAHYLRFLRTSDPSVQTLLAWRRSWLVLVQLQGALWALAVWLFYGRGTTFHTIGLIVMAYTYCLGSVQMLAGQPRVFITFISIVLVPTIARVATDTSQPWHAQLAGLLALLFGITVLMGRTYRSALDVTVALKVRTERLAAQLRVEMAAADEARRAAEAASRAKTQFFAAASHDLRQPLHAMGLFAEALRQRSHDSEAAALVNSINESVDALEGLFGELLDITRIDSGGVDVKPQPVSVRELFARLKLQFEPVAFEKGLALRFPASATCCRPTR